METYEYLKKLYTFILENYSEKYEIEFVAHYIDELSSFQKDFPGHTIRYSYDSKDYLGIFDRYDLIIGHRVHGIGMSASLGVPGIMIAHDERAQTVQGFLGSLITVGTDLSTFDQHLQEKITDIASFNDQLVKHKQHYMHIYLEHLRHAHISD